MVSPNQVLVVTTSGLDGTKINKYLKPVSAHVVAGTNIFSDLAASFSDFFGGRSVTYQKQLTSIYNEAIERVKIAAYELGGNCVLGLKVDIDEISGKDKSMFMITAVGTAVIAELQDQQHSLIEQESVMDVVSVQKVNALKQKNKILKESQSADWNIDEATWDFIINNQVDEIFPAILARYNNMLSYQTEEAESLFKKVPFYINNLPDDKKFEILYDAILKEEKRTVVKKLSGIISQLQMLDPKRILKALEAGSTEEQKRAILLLTSDKPFYNAEDLQDLARIKAIISEKFRETGSRSTKKQLLSSKEKEVWLCKCGQSNETDNTRYCTKCNQDIYGFKTDELSPDMAIKLIDQRMELISYFIA